MNMMSAMCIYMCTYTTNSMVYKVGVYVHKKKSHPLTLLFLVALQNLFLNEARYGFFFSQLKKIIIFTVNTVSTSPTLHSSFEPMFRVKQFHFALK